MQRLYKHRFSRSERLFGNKKKEQSNKKLNCSYPKKVNRNFKQVWYCPQARAFCKNRPQCPLKPL